MFIKPQQLKLGVPIILLTGFFSIISIAATRNDESLERSIQTADSAGSPEVFYPDYSEEAADAALAKLHELGQADARQWRVVTLNPELRPDLSADKQKLDKDLKSTLRGRLTFNLFPDAVYEVANKKIEITEENSLIWRGHATGPLHGGRFWFTLYPNGTVYGRLMDGPRSFELSHLPGFPGLSVLYEIDLSSQPPLREPEDLESGTPPDWLKEPETPAKEDRASTPQAALPPPGTQATTTTYRVDVMFVYTEAALRKMTTQAPSRLDYLNDARDQLNDVFNDSLSGADSNVRLNFVNLGVSQKISYKESDRENLNGDQVVNLRDDIEWVATNTALQKIRKDNKVDIVIMIVDRPPEASGAVGSIRNTAPLSRNSQANESSAYALVTVDQALRGGHFAHEACHIFSCRHEPEVDRAYAATAPFNANHGHVGVKPDDVDLPEDRQFKVGTNESVNCSSANRCYKKLLFSSPLYYLEPGVRAGVPAGARDSEGKLIGADNVSTIRATAPTVSQFGEKRAASGGGTPPPGGCSVEPTLVATFPFLSSAGMSNIVISSA